MFSNLAFNYEMLDIITRFKFIMQQEFDIGFTKTIIKNFIF